MDRDCYCSSGNGHDAPEAAQPGKKCAWLWTQADTQHGRNGHDEYVRTLLVAGRAPGDPCDGALTWEKRLPQTSQLGE